MPRFFIRADQIDGDTVTIMGDDAHHISRSLRMAAGETVTVCDENAVCYACKLTEFLPDRVLAKVLSREKSETEPPFFAHIYQGLPKGDKLDSIIQKSVECGASALTTFESEFCVARAKDAENEQKKVERRQRIALEAAKQSRRGLIPEIHPTISFAEMLEEAAGKNLAFFCYEDEKTVQLPNVLREAKKSGKPLSDIAIVVGSEGGFSSKEAAMAERAGLIPVGLGKRILRTETAASFALACLVCELELLDD